VATLRRLHPAPPAIKASAIVKGRILFATSFIFPFYSVLPDTLLGAVRCISKENFVTAHRHALGCRAETGRSAQQESLIQIHELGSRFQYRPGQQPCRNKPRPPGCQFAEI